jgi:16S rRNA (guanine966-N2)-methyltransferase
VQRIESGRLRGRRLRPLPKGVDGLRPMAARIRAAVFDRLQHEVVGATVLDLFAGSGAIAFEALSRGASRATLVEADPRVVRHLRAQAADLGLADLVDVCRGSLPEALEHSPPQGPYDLVTMDPPFARPDVFAPVAAALLAHGWLRPGSILVCESQRVRGTSAAGDWPAGYRLDLSRAYGQAQVDFLSIPEPDKESTP